MGPGGHLTLLIESFGVRVKGCHCAEHAAEMDIRGVEWCKANVPKIVGWMREEATRLRWWFWSDSIATVVVERAIKRAEGDDKSGLSPS